jgi:hypothetical protein
LTATHRTELFLLGLTGVFDISFGIEKLFAWADRPLSPLGLGLFFLFLGLTVAAVGVYNLIQDVRTDCQDSPDDCDCTSKEIK